MKSFVNILVTSVLALGSITTYAQDLSVSGDVGVVSNDVYRGQLLSNDGSAFGDVTLNNILLDGVYARVSGSTTNLVPVNGYSTVPLDYGLGYAHSVDNLGFDVSVNHTYDTNYYPIDYTEVRGTLSYKLLSDFKVYTQIGQLVTADLPKDTYGAVGAEYTDTTYTNVTVGGLVSGYRYGGSGTVGNFTTSGAFTNEYVNNHQTKYNNSELYASYPVPYLKNLSLLAGYSFGGYDRFGNDVGNEGWVGAKYSF